MLEFCEREFPGIGTLEGIYVPIEQIRRMAGLFSLVKVAEKVVHVFSEWTVERWETSGINARNFSVVWRCCRQRH